jgi:hypothetical protein
MGSESRLAVVSPVDAAWLRMDSETNPMVVTSLLGLDGPLEPSALADLVARVAASTRFHQRIASAPLTLGRAHWRDDPDFDVSRHVHRGALPAGASDGSALVQLVGHIMSQPWIARAPSGRSTCWMGCGTLPAKARRCSSAPIIAWVTAPLSFGCFLTLPVRVGVFRLRLRSLDSRELLEPPCRVGRRTLRPSRGSPR